MAVKTLGKFGRISTLAMAFAALTLPGLAAAQDDGRGGPGWRRGDAEARGNIGGSYQPPQRSAPAERRSGGGEGWARPTTRSAPVATPAPAPVSAPTATMGDRRSGETARSWRGRGDSGATWNGGARGDWRGNGAATASAPIPAPVPAPAPAARSAPGGNWSRTATATSGTYGNDDRRERRTERSGRDDRRDDRRDGWRSTERRTGADVWRNDTRRDDRRDNWRDDDRRRDDNRYRSNSWNRDRYADGRDYRRWDNRWRDNSRYNWSSYRRTHPSIYRLGSYYSPYRNYSYRRLSIGFFLDSLFFSSRYWINDPWQYHLPDVYGPYRWVRYYDDALLVNIYSGEVVDVIHDFFW